MTVPRIWQTELRTCTTPITWRMRCRAMNNCRPSDVIQFTHTLRLG